ncbi:BPSL0761 family protein [Variovorax saccharolyticus]|uniref:BPSL0761 family protein n=1 Tax=Variovorax saccharolyticus TaxID=3053516 RepID=UPI00336A46D9
MRMSPGAWGSMEARIMTMPSERTRAVVETRRFLEKLAAGRMARESPERLQSYASSLLCHYPNDSDMHLTASFLPAWWSPPEEPQT